MKNKFEHEIRLALGNLISKYRAEHGESVAQFAKGSGISVSTVQRLEHGAGNPSLFMACRIAAHMGVTLEDLSSACLDSIQSAGKGQERP